MLHTHIHARTHTMRRSSCGGGGNLPKKRTRILNHLDRISFAGGAIFLFYYPLLNKLLKELVEKNATENEDMEMETRKEQAWAEM